MITSAQTAPGRFIFPTLGKTARISSTRGEDERGWRYRVGNETKCSGNVWNPAWNALLVESNSLKSGIKNQLAGVRDE